MGRQCPLKRAAFKFSISGKSALPFLRIKKWLLEANVIWPVTDSGVIQYLTECVAQGCRVNPWTFRPNTKISTNPKLRKSRAQQAKETDELIQRIEQHYAKHSRENSRRIRERPRNSRGRFTKAGTQEEGPTV